jgi:hypothetical protein
MNLKNIDKSLDDWDKGLTEFFYLDGDEEEPEQEDNLQPLTKDESNQLDNICSDILSGIRKTYQ